MLEHSLRQFTVHSQSKCADQDVCSIHNRSDHHMRQWTQDYRNDRDLMERVCPHGIGHPDPDHIAGIKYFWTPDLEEFYGCTLDEYVYTQGVHGCDSCCQEKVDTATPAAPSLGIPRYIAPDDVDQYELEGCGSGGCGCSCDGADGPPAQDVPTDGLPD